MYLSRFIREAEDEGESYVWYPPKGQIGTPWLNLAENSTEDNPVEVLHPTGVATLGPVCGGFTPIPP